MSYQPEYIIFQDSDLLSTRETELENWRLYLERKGRKQKCAEPGCITYIGYLQDEYCRRHEQVANEREFDARVRKELKKSRREARGNGETRGHKTPE